MTTEKLHGRQKVTIIQNAIQNQLTTTSRLKTYEKIQDSCLVTLLVLSVTIQYKNILYFSTYMIIWRNLKMYFYTPDHIEWQVSRRSYL